MQMNDKVLNALEVLREYAENDFERHRIEVLIQDLIDPPKAEQIDDSHQKFNGVVYSKHNDDHYGTIHRDIWRYYCGEIPDGYEVHHKDLNPENNDISNLQILTRAEHRKLHQNMAKLHLERTFSTYTCENCGKTFKARTDSNRKFCSYKCRRAKEFELKRKEKSRRICKNCGKEFFAARDIQAFCCDNCRRLYYHKKEKRYEKVCPICGKTFKTRTEKSVCCSIKCANALRLIAKKNS